MNSPPHSLTRAILVHAQRALVFRHFTDPERFARWWGPGSTVDGRVGGSVRIVYPNRVVAGGSVTRLEADRVVAFTYGYEDPQRRIPVGGSQVTIELHDHAEGTRLQLRHDLPTETDRDQHDPGWRFQLALVANAAANEQHAGLPTLLDQWFAAWSERDVAARDRLLALCTTDDVTMQDYYACLAGRADLSQHIAMCLVHAPSTSMRRVGEPRHCQGTALAEWVAQDAAGKPCGKGTNVVRLAADGRIAGVVGFW